MQTPPIVLAGLAALLLFALGRSLRIVQHHDEGLLFRLGRVVGLKEPGLVPLVPVITTVSWRSTCWAPAGCGALTHRRVPETTAAAGPHYYGCGR